MGERDDIHHFYNEMIFIVSFIGVTLLRRHGVHSFLASVGDIGFAFFMGPHRLVNHLIRLGALYACIPFCCVWSSHCSLAITAHRIPSLAVRWVSCWTILHLMLRQMRFVFRWSILLPRVDVVQT